MRKGVTLAEILVATALMTAVVGSAMLLYNLSGKSRGATAAAQGLSTAMIIEETILSDLRRLIQVGPSPVRFWADNPARLAFVAIDLSGPAGATLSARPVRYSISPTTKLLERAWGAQVRAVGSSPLASLSFHPFNSPTGPMIRVNLEIGRAPDEPAGPPVVHSFLAPISSPRRRENLQIKLVEKFPDPGDLPIDQALPEPAPAGPPPALPAPGAGAGPSGPDDSPPPAPGEQPKPRPSAR